MKKILLTIGLLVAFAGAASAAEAKDNWAKHCVSCHGKDGKGQTTMGRKAGAKDYTDARTWEGFDDAKAIKSVKEGMKEGDKEKMKPFADKLTDDEIKALIAYLRTFKK